MADYFEIFDDKRAGILGALDRAVTDAHAWEFLAHWDPEWEMVALPSIENRLPNYDAYDPDMYSDCFDMMWEIARSDWLSFRETYIEEHPACRCRQTKGKLADFCWPRYPENGECAMCDEIRNYASIFDSLRARVASDSSCDRACTDICACACGRYGCLETVASLFAIKKRARVFLKQQASADNPALVDGELDTAQLLALYHQGDTMIRALVDEGARAIGLSLYNFLNILKYPSRQTVMSDS
jgi:hypothetical protein